MKGSSVTQQVWVAHVLARGSKVIRMEGETRPPNVNETRLATEEEIQGERERRANRERDISLRKAFDERQDVKDARMVCGAIEFMEIGDGLIDRLTPAEWADLRRKLS
jgi:hypothetical protein